MKELCGRGVFVIEKEKYLWGFVDSKDRNHWIIPPTFLELEEFQNGWARVKINESQWRLINEDGKYHPKYSFIGETRNGWTKVQIIDDIHYSSRLVNEKGEYHSRFSNIGDFHDGLAFVHLIGGKSGYIDENEKLIMGPFSVRSVPFGGWDFPKSREYVSFIDWWGDRVTLYRNGRTRYSH